MYSSNSSLNGNNLTFSSSKSLFCNSFESNSTSSKDQQNNIHSLFPLPPFPFFQFPNYPDDVVDDPFQDNQHMFLQQHHDDDGDFQLHHSPHVVSTDHNHNHQDQQRPSNSSIINIANNDIVNNLVSEAGATKGKTIVNHQVKQIQQRKRSSKRDRHSKIKTAKGLRDRRMRLSLEVAKRFFGLQDMLGFEKASKTVDWLLNQSKLEIKHLAREKNLHFPTKSSSSTSECTEGVSSLDNEVENLEEEEPQQKQEKVIMMKRTRNRTNKVCRKSAFNSISREKARERARERTKEKLMKARTSIVLVDESSSKQCNDEGKGTKTNLIWNPFESVEESGGCTHQKQSVNHSFDHMKLINEGEVERNSQKAKEQDSEEDDSLFIMSKWSPPMIFNSLNNLQQVSSNYILMCISSPSFTNFCSSCAET
jgi:hypothetical protein